MATRRRIGVSIATTESARRQLMQPVPCWEKVWVTPEDAPTGSTLKVYQWIKTDKRQNFSDEEDEPDEPLAPLPDEPEVIDGEEDMDQDDPAASVVPDTTSASRAVSEPVTAPLESQAASGPSQPHPLSMSLIPSPTPDDVGAEDELDVALQPNVPPHAAMDITASLEAADPSSMIDDIPTDLNPEDLSLDLSGLGPDGEQFDGAHDLAQLQDADVLLGGDVMDQNVDPFISGP